MIIGSTKVRLGGSPAVGYYISPTGSDTTGDGSIGNPAASISKFLSVASPGDTLIMRGGTYPVSGNAGQTISVASTTIKAHTGETPSITDTIKRKLLVVNAANVTIDGLELHGTGDVYPAWETSSANWGYGVYVNPGANNPTIKNCTVHDFNHSGIWLDGGVYGGAGLSNISVTDNDVGDCVYIGIVTSGVTGGEILRNTVIGIGDNGFQNDNVPANCNAYGIALTAWKTTPSSPMSTGILVQDNVVSYVTRWHAYDTHAGQDNDFIHNESHFSARGFFITANQASERATRNRILYNLIANAATDTYGTNAVGCTYSETIDTEFGWNHIDSSYAAPAPNGYDYLGNSTGLFEHDNSTASTLPTLP